MATEKQRQFVNDIEAAVKAVALREMKGVSIAELCEMAGVTSVDMRLFVQRLMMKGDRELIGRLQAAFNSVGLSPKPIYDAMAYLNTDQSTASNFDSEPLRLERENPPASTVNGSAAVKFVGTAQVPDAGDVLRSMIAILDPLPERFQKRILTSVSVYYGVGE